jgi:long-chain acyl-CoA synthetase
MEFNRLFDYLLFQKNDKPNAKFLSAKDPKTQKWKTYTFEDTYLNVVKTAQLLHAHGMQEHDRVAIIATNCPEWNFIDLGVQIAGGIGVPMYPTISEEDYAYIFNNAEIKIAFVGNLDIYNKIKKIQNSIPSLEHIIPLFPNDVIKHYSQYLDAITIDDDAALQYICKIRSEDLATIIYTSGTTGQPKGVMLSHHNMVSNLKDIQKELPLTEGKKSLSFLPLCHSFERLVFYAYLANAVHIYYAESLEKISNNLQEVRPYCFTTVPRLLEKVYDKILDKATTLSPMKKKMLDWAIDLGKAYEFEKEQHIPYAIQLGIARSMVFSKWREALGGELEFIVTGAAPIQPRLARLFTAAGINVLEGYGLTETSPVLACNKMDKKERCFGTVGIPLEHVTIRLAEDGEILAKGPNIMKGYYKRQDLTDEVIDSDGWFHTGDIGEWVEGKFLKITDRKKELFKTSGGKYIAPQSLENKMKESRYVEQIMVVGEYRKFVSALIVPNFIYLHEYAKIEGIVAADDGALVIHPKVLALFQAEINSLNAHFGKWEQIKKFILLDAEWTMENGVLTPTLKLKRKVLLERYAKDIEALYENS